MLVGPGAGAIGAGPDQGGGRADRRSRAARAGGADDRRRQAGAGLRARQHGPSRVHHPGPERTRRRPRRSCWPRRARTAYRAPHFVYAVRREAARLLGDENLLDRGGLRIDTTLQYDGYQRAAEKWARVAYDLDRLSDEQLAAALRRRGAGLDQAAAGPQHQQRRAGDAQLPDRGGDRLRRLGELLRRGHARAPAAVRRGGPGLSPVRLGLQADHLRHRLRARRAHARRP